MFIRVLTIFLSCCRIIRSPSLVKRLIESDNGTSDTVVIFFTSMLSSLVEVFPPSCDKKQPIMTTHLSDIDCPLLQLVDAFRFASSIRWSSECVSLSLLLRRLAHVITLVLSGEIKSDDILKNGGSVNVVSFLFFSTFSFSLNILSGVYLCFRHWYL